ncbi:MAG: AAA family ATPase [Polyangiales bacterium]
MASKTPRRVLRARARQSLRAHPAEGLAFSACRAAAEPPARPSRPSGACRSCASISEPLPEVKRQNPAPTSAARFARKASPCVLWIDEIEKGLGRGDNDGGTSQRVFGTFLAWLQEKKESVFVIATANDISDLPPELLRKGRFDEIFFVDLPSADTRAHIFEVHLRRRGRDPKSFDLAALAEAAEDFSGAEIEQAVVSALYSAFEAGGDIDTEAVLVEVRATHPLSETMREQLQKIRSWAHDRAVPAE